MGLFDKFFKSKEKKTIDYMPGEGRTENVKAPVSVKREIDTILKILENLGILEEDQIEKALDKEENLDKTILSKMDLKASEDNVDYLKKYIEFKQIGYGRETINLYRRRLEEISKEEIAKGKEKEEIIEKLISNTKVEIDNYERILKSINKEIKEIEEDSKNENEILQRVGILAEQYKEEALGYPINLENQVKKMANELAQLPYGGYGEEEVERFLTAAGKMIEEGKMNQEETNHTYSRIKVELYDPKKKRYLSDLETLNKKIQMISESPYISEFEKEQNKLKIITEFNQMNGHKMGINDTIKNMIKNLSNLENGGFGQIELNKFETKVKEIKKNGEEANLKRDDILNQIYEEYNKLLREYELELMRFKEEMESIKDLEEEEKEEKQKDYLEYFKDKMGHPIDYQTRILDMKQSLETLEEGGYSSTVTDDFKMESMTRAENAKTPEELTECMKEIRNKYREMISQYKEKKKEYQEEKQKIENSKNVSKEEIEIQLESLRNKFLSNFGHTTNYEEIIQQNKNKLSSLEKGGYGKTVLDKYENDCKRIITEEKDKDSIYHEIQKKYLELKKQYEKNLEIFTEWKKLQLNNKKKEEVEEQEKELDEKISHMLSLSKEELYDYYIEDDRKKKAQAYRHNYMAAYRYLAREEANKKQNEDLYRRRLEELQEDKQPYTNEEIEEATKKIEIMELNNSKLTEEDRIISLMEYIDSTLFRQMIYVEAMLANKRDQTKI